MDVNWIMISSFGMAPTRKSNPPAVFGGGLGKLSV
jgi:hypothetical protein